MRRLLILKMGSTLPTLLPRRGDYDDWIRRGAGLPPDQVEVVDAREETALPAPEELAGVAVTGSSALVSRREPWSERAGAWLRRAVEAETPVLGICYGHQLLAQALGGRVARNPRGREIGSVEVRLRDAARDDALLGGMPPALRVQASHVEAVLELPPGARWLAESDRDPHQAFAIGTSAWGVQFHPEFDAEIVRAYLDARRDALRKEGLDADALWRRAGDSPHGGELLRRFAKRLRA